jgi:cytochrome c oxidase cbb3-type subunit 2
MNPGPLVFLATFFAMATSWLGFVLFPQLQLGGQQQSEVKETGLMYPAMRAGMARQGEAVYRANGCFYCHSQQVRPQGYGSDVARGWGGRNSRVQSVAADYLYDLPVMIGSQRVGPDLTNIGLRETNTVWLYQHLYDPQSVSPQSTMPPYRFLFKKSQLGPGEKPLADALLSQAGAEGYQIVPKDDARALVAYLLSLHSDANIFEAPPIPKPLAKTNAPSATATNAPAK